MSPSATKPIIHNWDACLILALQIFPTFLQRQIYAYTKIYLFMDGRSSYRVNIV